jgi:hypothetical protein
MRNPWFLKAWIVELGMEPFSRVHVKEWLRMDCSGNACDGWAQSCLPRNIARWSTLVALLTILLLGNLSSRNIAAAAELDPVVQWFVSLVQKNNGKAFCASNKLKWGEVGKAYDDYVKSHHLTGRLTDQQAVQVLARIYPCSAGPDLANTEISQSTGRQMVVVPTGEYATINMKPTITLLQKLQTTSGRENDALMAEIEQNPGNYVPPVLMALAVVRFREGRIEDALFWYNAGRLRAMYDAARCSDMSARSAVTALVYKTPKELLKAQFDDLTRLRNIVTRVVKWDEVTPQNYEYRWISLHGMGAINSGFGNTNGSSSPLTVSREKWGSLAIQTREEFRTGMEKAIEQYQKQSQQASGASKSTH